MSTPYTRQGTVSRADLSLPAVEWRATKAELNSEKLLYKAQTEGKGCASRLTNTQPLAQVSLDESASLARKRKGDLIKNPVLTSSPELFNFRKCAKKHIAESIPDERKPSSIVTKPKKELDTLPPPTVPFRTGRGARIKKPAKIFSPELCGMGFS